MGGWSETLIFAVVLIGEDGMETHQPTIQKKVTIVLMCVIQ